MRLVVVCVALAMLFAGCAEVQEEAQEAVQENQDEFVSDDGNTTVEEPVTGLLGEVVVTLDNTTVMAGTPFNVTIDYAGDDLDLANATWTVEFTPVGNATDNATAEPVGNVTTYNGTGLPAVLEANLTEAGNVTMAVVISNGNDTIAGELVEMVVEIDPASLDPCLGAPIQEPFTMEALYVGAAVNGIGFYQANPFTLEPCQTYIHVKITASEAYVDPMLRLKDNTGATVDAEDNEFLYTDTLTYEPGGYLEPGTWQIDARAYAGGPGNYVLEFFFE